jgi:PhnB protein
MSPAKAKPAPAKAKPAPAKAEAKAAALAKKAAPAAKTADKPQVKPIPDGYTSVTPYIMIEGASEAIEFYKKAFGAQELERMSGPDGKVLHAEIRIGNAIVMLSDASAQWKGPKALGGSPASICLYVPDADAVFKAAVDAGATVRMPIQEQFWGDRYGMLVDPFGHNWSVATHVEDVTKEEMQKRMEKAMAEWAKQGAC